MARIHWSKTRNWTNITLPDLRRIYGTKIGEEMLLTQIRKGITVDIRHNSRGLNEGYFGTGEVYLDYIAAQDYIALTPVGITGIPTDALLAHELGHAVLGHRDDGPQRMNNINIVENAYRIEVGLPPRLTYCGAIACE